MNTPKNISVNNFYSFKCNKILYLLIALNYIFIITLAPLLSATFYSKNNFFQNKNYLFLNKSKNNINVNQPAYNTSYILDEKIIARQVDNSLMQLYLKNVKNDIIGLVDNNSKQQYQYDTYGKLILNKTNKTQQNIFVSSFMYNGERFDTHTNLQYLRARFYLSNIKRFVTQDSYELLNRFAYADANPIMKTDPTGHLSVIARSIIKNLVFLATVAIVVSASAYIVPRFAEFLMNSRCATAIFGAPEEDGLLLGGGVTETAETAEAVTVGVEEEGIQITTPQRLKKYSPLLKTKVGTGATTGIVAGYAGIATTTGVFSVIDQRNEFEDLINSREIHNPTDFVQNCIANPLVANIFIGICFGGALEIGLTLAAARNAAAVKKLIDAGSGCSAASEITAMLGKIRKIGAGTILGATTAEFVHYSIFGLTHKNNTADEIDNAITIGLAAFTASSILTFFF